MSFFLRLHTYNKKRNLQKNWNLQKKLKASGSEQFWEKNNYLPQAP